MTMTAKMNCEHDGDGWCLSCVGELSDAYDILRRQADDLAAALKEARGLLRRYTEFPTCAKCQGYEMCEDCADEYAAIQADADAFLAGQPAPKPAESEARMLRKCLARVRATIDSDEELKARYVAAAAKMPLEQEAP